MESSFGWSGVSSINHLCKVSLLTILTYVVEYIYLFDELLGLYDINVICVIVRTETLSSL